MLICQWQLATKPDDFFPGILGNRLAFSANKVCNVLVVTWGI
jgi:hypothetical protein